MTRLYLAPVGADWQSRFSDTVAEPITLQDELDDDLALPAELQERDELRLWGTTEGEQTQRYFEAMEPGDPVLFYSEGSYFASGRVGTTLVSTAVGEEVWGSAESTFLYTVTDYQEHAIEPATVNDLLDYSDGYVPQGFMRVSETAIDALLTEYNSVEEAFQELRATDAEPTDGDNKLPEEESDTSEHTKIQWLLIQLGLTHGYDVYVAKNDQSRTYNGQELGAECVDELSLAGFSDAAARIIEYVDVIWLEDEFIVKLFEVEHTTSIYSGILRMTDFVVKVPNIAVDMHIVAAQADEDKVRREISRPTFQEVLAPAEHSTLSYLSFGDVEQTYELVEEVGPLQEVF